MKKHVRRRRTIELSQRGTTTLLALAMLIPLGFVGLGGWFILDGLRFSASAVKVEARVIDTGRVQHADGDHFRPLFQFETPQGTIIEARADTAASYYGFAEGSSVTVLFNPARPDHVRPHGIWMQYGIWLIFLALGGFVLAAFARAIGPMLLHDWRSRDAP